MDKQKRESFRVEFPRSHYPVININGKLFDVFDASEFGIKFYSNKNSSFKIDQSLSASIIFPDQESYTINASIVRIETNFISIKLSTPLPLSKIRSEHLFLMQKFPEKRRA